MIYPEDNQERIVRKTEDAIITALIGAALIFLIAAFAIGCTPTRKASDPIGPYHVRDPLTFQDADTHEGIFNQDTDIIVCKHETLCVGEVSCLPGSAIIICMDCETVMQ